MSSLLFESRRPRAVPSQTGHPVDPKWGGQPHGSKTKAKGGDDDQEDFDPSSFAPKGRNDGPAGVPRVAEGRLNRQSKGPETLALCLLNTPPASFRSTA